METTLHSTNAIEHKPERANFIRNHKNIAVTAPSQKQRRFINSAANNCGNCGYFLPHKGPCPARGKTCNSCRKMNHFAPGCRGTCRSQPPHRPLRCSSNVRTSRINQIEAELFSMPTPESPPNSNDDDYLFTLDRPAPHAKTTIATMKILNKNVQMILDTGASTDILDNKTFDFLTRDHRVTLQRSSTRLLHMVQIPP